MKLPDSLVKQFTESTKDTPDAEKQTESYATVVSDGLVRLDGSSVTTPCENTVAVNQGDRVLVKIENHKAVITGNLTSPALDETATEDVFESLIGDVEEGLQTQITQNAEAIKLKASKTTVDDLEGRVSTAETNITQNANAITLKASQSSVNSLGQRVTSAESTISLHTDQIAMKVEADDVINAINLSSSGATINASKINLTGYTTINNGFIVKRDGTVSMNDAYANNLSVSGDSAVVGNLKLYSGLHTNEDSDIYLRGRIYLGDYPEEYIDPYNEMTLNLPYVYIGHSSDKSQLLIRPGTYKQYTYMDEYITRTHDVRLGTTNNPFSYVRATNISATTINADTIKENGTALYNKYAAYSHSHSGYASSSHTHSDYSKLLTVASKSASTGSITAGKYAGGSFSIAKSGYTPLGVVGYDITGSRSNFMNLYRSYVSGSTYYWQIRNFSDETVTDTIEVWILYVKN